MKEYKPFFLLEGKQQAIQILKKDVPPEDMNTVISDLSDIDPTSPQNKYLELLAKIYLPFRAQLIRKSRVEEGEDDHDFIFSFTDILVHKNDIKTKLADIEKRNLKLNTKKITDIDSFIKEVKEVYSTVTKSKAKQGLVGLTKGKDYIQIPLSYEGIHAYIPLNYKASKVIASDRVGDCEGKWCTAYQKTDEHWNDYVSDRGGILVYLINPYEQDSSDSKKAFYFYSNDVVEGFDAEDEPISFYTGSATNKEIEKYVRSNWDEIRKAYNFRGLELPKILYLMVMEGRLDEQESLRHLKDLLYHDTYADYTVDLPIVIKNQEAFYKDKHNPKFSFAIEFNSNKLNSQYKLSIFPPEQTGLYVLDKKIGVIADISSKANNVFINQTYEKLFSLLTDDYNWDMPSFPIKFI